MWVFAGKFVIMPVHILLKYNTQFYLFMSVFEFRWDFFICKTGKYYLTTYFNTEMMFWGDSRTLFLHLNTYCQKSTLNNLMIVEPDISIRMYHFMAKLFRCIGKRSARDQSLKIWEWGNNPLSLPSPWHGRLQQPRYANQNV